MEGERNELRCELCGWPFKSSRALRAHYDRKHGRGKDDELVKSIPKSPKKACPRCGKLVTNPWTHQNACRGESAKSAPIKASKWKAELTGSETSISEDVTEPAAEAGTKTLTEAEKRESEKTMYSKAEKAEGRARPGGITERERNERRPCLLCDASFRQTRTLIKHYEMRHVLGEGDYDVPKSPKKGCRRCGKYFANLWVHKKRCKGPVATTSGKSGKPTPVEASKPSGSSPSSPAIDVAVLSRDATPVAPPQIFESDSSNEGSFVCINAVPAGLEATPAASGSTRTSDDAAGTAQRDVSLSVLLSAARTENVHRLSQARFLELYRNWIVRSHQGFNAESVQALVVQVLAFIAVEKKRNPHFRPRQWLMFAVEEVFTPLRPLMDWIPPGSIQALSRLKAEAHLHLVSLIDHCLGQTSGTIVPNWHRKDFHLKSLRRGQISSGSTRPSHQVVASSYRHLARRWLPASSQPSASLGSVAPGDEEGGSGMPRGASDAKPDEEMETEEVAPEATPVQEAVAAEATQTETTDNDTRQLCHGSTFFQVDHQEVTVFIML